MSPCLMTKPPGDKQYQISRGDNYNKFYLLLLFDHRGFGVWGFES